MLMRLIPSTIPEVLLIEPQIYTDERGFFMEVYQAQWFTKAGLESDFVQDNQSGSRQGTLRGLHYQIQHPQTKLVRVIAGEVYDVAVDLRRSSPYFGKWAGVTLSAQNRRQLWIPIGFAHGIYILSDWAEVLYKVSDYYAPEAERTLLWNDPQLGIQWPLLDNSETILSEKDAHGTPLNQAELYD
jgi:dTDP-4-dehydrorhamnose 3,5-epimerase